MKKYLLKSDYPPLIVMILLIIILLLSFMFSPAVFAQTFQKTYGGTNLEMAWDFQPTADGGYIMTGTSSSYFGLAGTNLYLVKTNGSGDTLWTRAYTGTSSGLSAKQTADGGYILSGGTYLFSTGGQDGYVIKTDNVGNILWSKTYGGPLNDEIVSVLPSSDGGYMLFGSTSSFGQGSFDIYLIKTNNTGDTIWTKTLGGPGEESVWGVKQTYDSGYIIVGQTASYGAGLVDALLVKTDKHGNLTWTKTFGGIESDAGYAVMQTSDSGYIMSGKTHSFGAFFNDGDLYLVRTNKNGDTLWTKTYGGAGTDVGRSVIQTNDGGFMVTGHTWSFGAGESDIYFVRTNMNGNLIWSRTYGGSLMDDAVGVVQTGDGGYAAGGFTENFGAGVLDYIMIRTDSGGHSGCSEDSPVTLQTQAATATFSPSMAEGGTNSDVANFAVFSTGGGVVTPICTPLAIIENTLPGGIQVYPNPAYGNFTVTCYPGFESTVSVLNILGDKLVEKTIDAVTSSIEIAIPGLSPGIYLVRVQNATGQYTHKLVIQ